MPQGIFIYRVNMDEVTFVLSAVSTLILQPKRHTTKKYALREQCRKISLRLICTLTGNERGMHCVSPYL